MCRMLAYAGAPIVVGSLLFDAPHSLAHQAASPRHLPGGLVSGDGCGLAWYDPGRAEPLRYRSTRPMWEDDALRERAASVRSGFFVAAARAATPGLPVEEASSAPFVSGRYAFSLNGWIENFGDGAGPRLRAMITPERARGIQGRSDAEVLFAIALGRIDAGKSMPDALAFLEATCADLSDAPRTMLIADGERAAASVHGRSLFLSRRASATIFSSEPLDDGAWSALSDGSFVVATAHGAAVGDGSEMQVERIEGAGEPVEAKP